MLKQTLNLGNISVSKFMIAGMDDPNRPYTALNKVLKDEKRTTYHRDYLSNLFVAIRFVCFVVNIFPTFFLALFASYFQEKRN